MNQNRTSDVVLVAVNDSRAAFAAAKVAVEYCAKVGAQLRAVSVIEASELDQHLGDTAALAQGRELAASAALNHVVASSSAANVTVSVTTRIGSVAAEILAEARESDAVMIVMARVSRPGHALPYVGSQTLRVLEFATVPVLVVPTYAQ
ncbi:MAG TPA: universal stress protein [Candidatus Nanopelagicaceae bacterium]|nr:universal stress protein [Candidatus Nanopelagicaceae bacterium]